jgi:hypothetical protein
MGENVVLFALEFKYDQGHGSTDALKSDPGSVQKSSSRDFVREPESPEPAILDPAARLPFKASLPAFGIGEPRGQDPQEPSVVLSQLCERRLLRSGLPDHSCLPSVLNDKLITLIE